MLYYIRIFGNLMVLAAATSVSSGKVVKLLPQNKIAGVCTNAVLSQCGGINFIGSVCCPAGTCCTYANAFWSDCQPSANACTGGGSSTFPSLSPSSALTSSPSTYRTKGPTTSPSLSSISAATISPSTYRPTSASSFSLTSAPSSSIKTSSPSTAPPTSSFLTSAPSSSFVTSASIFSTAAPTSSFSSTISPNGVPSTVPSGAPIIPSLLPTGVPSSRKPSAEPSTSSTSSPSKLVFSYFSTKGSQIIDLNGNNVRIAAVNWYGFESPTFILLGLSVRSYTSIVDQIKTMGFNTIRVPFSSQMLTRTTPPTGINYNLNSDLLGLSPLQCLDALVSYCGKVGIRVILTRNSCYGGQEWNEKYWFVPSDLYYTEGQFTADWLLLSERYKASAVIGVDLWNQPKPPYASWGWVGDNTKDWHLAAQATGNAILAVNPYWLIFIAGLGTNGWMGSDLTYVQYGPVQLSLPYQLVYETHEMSQDVYPQPWFSDPTYPANLRGLWRSRWGYLQEQGNSPVFMGSFGTSFLYSTSDDQWLKALVRYLNGEFNTDNVNSLLPGQMGVSWAIGLEDIGILNADFQTVKTQMLSYISPSMFSTPSLAIIPSPPSVSPSRTSTRSPSVIPTVNPSGSPSAVPTIVSSIAPSGPSLLPTVLLSFSPSGSPSVAPTSSPSVIPTANPSGSPSGVPTTVPSVAPSGPSLLPTVLPSGSPSDSPSVAPSSSPSVIPTWAQSLLPTTQSITPTSAVPTFSPSSKLVILTSCLGSALASQLYSSSNPGNGYASYDWLRTSNNNRIQRYPIAILMIQNLESVSKAVLCAKSSGISPVVRSGGHSYEGLSSLDGKLVIDVSNCNSVTSIYEDPIGSGRFKATFESGIRLGKLYTDLWNRGQWSFAAGSCAWVGSGGHLTGGGQGMQTRMYGLAMDLITSIDIVLADGSAVTANSNNQYADLFWALRGAGSSSFGVITRFTLWQTAFLNFPKELGANMWLNPGSFNIAGHFLGPMSTLMTLLGPILSDPQYMYGRFSTVSGIEARSFVQFGADMAGTTPIQTIPKISTKTKTDFVAQALPDSVLSTLVTAVLSSQNMFFGSHLLGGANSVHAALASNATAYPARNAWHCVQYGTQTDYAVGSAPYNAVQTMQQALAPYVTGQKYYNYVDSDFPVDSYFGSNMMRLKNLKRKYDPSNVFNGPMTIPPS